MNSQQKFIFGIIVTAAIALSLMVASCNMAPADIQVVGPSPSNYELCLKSTQFQLDTCADNGRKRFDKQRTIANKQNETCVQLLANSFSRCEKFTTKQ